MKSLLFPLLMFCILPSVVSAQVATSQAKKDAQSSILLAGADEGVISSAKVVADPSVIMRDKSTKIDSFNFSWVAVTGNDREFMGPYHNKGNQLSAPCLAAFKNDADKNAVSRIFVDEVYAKNAKGHKVYFKAGGAFGVKK